MCMCAWKNNSCHWYDDDGDGTIDAYNKKRRRKDFELKSPYQLMEPLEWL